MDLFLTFLLIFTPQVIFSLSDRFPAGEECEIMLSTPGSEKYEKLEPGESCSEGKNIITYEECERAAKDLGIKFVWNDKTKCFATRRNFGDKKKREICHKSNAPSGTFFGEDLKEIYANTIADNQPSHKNARHYKCGINDIDTNGNDFNCGFTTMNSNQFWANATISWSFVSIGSDYKKCSFYEDANIGLSKADVVTVKSAMKQIEEKTCFKFEHVKKPTKGQPWLLIHRIGKNQEDLPCQLSYVQQNLLGKDIAGLGDIFDHLKDATDEDVCFPNGAFAYYGSASPQKLVISQIKLDPTDQEHVGLMVHEILHNLGIGHTNKRQDAKDHIEIKEENINKHALNNYKACSENDAACRAYNTYGTPYDCSSIMHYGDQSFITEEAKSRNEKTMVAKDPSTCKLPSFSPSQLSETDVFLINKMYCQA